MAAQVTNFLVGNVVKPTFNAAGRIIGGAIHQLEDSMEHHNHDGVQTIEGVDLVIREIAIDLFAHRLRLTVLYSPDNKMDGMSFENSGKHACNARQKCLDCFKAVVRIKYPNLVHHT